LKVYIQQAILSSREDSSTIPDPHLLNMWQKKIQSAIILFLILINLSTYSNCNVSLLLFLLLCYLT